MTRDQLLALEAKGKHVDMQTFLIFKGLSITKYIC